MVHFAFSFYDDKENTISRTEHDTSKKIIKCPPLVTKHYNTIGQYNKNLWPM